MLATALLATSVTPAVASTVVPSRADTKLPDHWQVVCGPSKQGLVCAMAVRVNGVLLCGFEAAGSSAVAKVTAEASGTLRPCSTLKPHPKPPSS